MKKSKTTNNQLIASKRQNALIGSLLLLLAVVYTQGTGAIDPEYDEYGNEIKSLGKALQISPPEDKRGGARPFALSSSGEKRGGGRSFSLFDEKRDGARSFGTSWKRGGGRYFSYFGDDSGSWPLPKRGGGRAFQFLQKRGGARSFVGGMNLGGGLDGGIDIIPNFPKSEQMYVAKANNEEANPLSNRYFYQNNHNFDGLKRAGSRTFVWPWMTAYGRPMSRGSYSFEE